MEQGNEREGNSRDERIGSWCHFQLGAVALALPRQPSYDNALMSERGRDVGTYLLSFLFPDQPVHRFLPLLKLAKFPLGEGLQRVVKDFG